MNKLKETSITKKDTCLSYVLKRTGIETSVEFVDTLEKDFEIIPSKKTKIQIGDIVAWEKEVKVINCVTTIKAPTEEGVSELITGSVSTRFHLGVVESLCTISDLTRSSNPYYIPTIRKRYLSLIVEDYQKQCPFPDYVIRKKNEHSGAS